MFYSGLPQFSLIGILRRRPDAAARIKGSSKYPEIGGTVRFYQTAQGTVVLTEVTGLPSDEGKCRGHIFGFHIHEGEKCSGNEKDPFAHTGTHYNPGECEHPNHAGDMPSLLGNRGIALSLFLTDRFSVREVIGRTAVIHSMPDDFTSQPSGNSGEKIACGEILRY